MRHRIATISNLCRDFREKEEVPKRECETNVSKAILDKLCLQSTKGILFS